jgi:hypothetical protein
MPDRMSNNMSVYMSVGGDHWKQCDYEYGFYSMCNSWSEKGIQNQSSEGHPQYPEIMGV